MGIFNAILGNASEVDLTQVAKEFEPILIDVIKFSKESAGILDLDAELKIWIKDETAPIVKQFGKGGNNINEVYKILSTHILK